MSIHQEIISCENNKCFYLYHAQICRIPELLHKRPILKDCPCKECIVRPICKSRCKTRVDYLKYLIDHIYETSKADHLIKLSKNINLNDFEDISVNSDSSSYDVTLRL